MKRLGDLLLEHHMITEGQLQEALALQKANPKKRLGAILLEKGWANQQEIIHLLGEQLKIPYIELSNYLLNEEVMAAVPKELMLKYQMVPLRLDEEHIVVAMADPLDVIAQDELSMATNKKVTPLLAKVEDIERILQEYFGARAAERVEIFPFADRSVTEAALSDREVLQKLILQAYRFGATELNLEPRHADVRIRYRLDGVPYDFPPLSKERQEGITAAVKELFQFKPEALPQVGRYFGTLDQHRINLRGFTMPTLFGERLSLRLLNLPSSFVTFQELGMPAEIQRDSREALQSPYGLFLLAGPADSGRSTTYYALLQQFEKSRKVVFSFEDPVEHIVPSVHQIQLKLESGFDYKRALESTLRQLPDVIFISRIAEPQVAQFANQLALSGRLVIGVVHTYDTALAIEKMLDFGIPPHLLASTLLGALSQRLLRVFCEHCRTELPGQKGYRAVGCSKCLYTGYHGRKPIFELLKVKEIYSEKIAQSLPAPLLRMAAEQTGMVTLTTQAEQWAKEGKTSTAEVQRVLRLE